MTWSSPTRGNQKHGLHVGKFSPLSRLSQLPHSKTGPCMPSGAAGLCLLFRNFTDNRSWLGDSTLANKPKWKTNTPVRRHYNGLHQQPKWLIKPVLLSMSRPNKDFIKVLMEQEVGISVQGEARAIWEVGGAVRMVPDAAPGPAFSSGSDHLVWGFVHAWPDIRVDGSV